MSSDANDKSKIKYPLKCNRNNRKSKYYNYLCNPDTNHWARISSPTGKKVVKRIEQDPRKCRSVNSKSLSADFICNPATARWVRKDGKVGKMVVTHYSRYVSGKPKQPKATKSSLQALKKMGAVKAIAPKMPPGYKFVQQLASSLSGYIYLAQDIKTGEKVVIKKYKDNIDPETAEKMSQQVITLSKIKSDYLLNYLSSYYDSAEQKFYLIMDYFDGHTLSNIDVKELTDEEKFQIILQLVLGLYDLHVEYGLAHEDLKLSSIMIGNQEPTIRYIGYGLIFDNNSWKKAYNLANESPYYRSPENIVITGKTLNKNVLKAGDIWSLAAIIYFLLTGHHAFKRPYEQSIEDINKNILTSQPNYNLLPKNFSKSQTFMKMLKGMFDTDYKKRLNIEDVVDLLEKSHKEIF
jgi:hypothetical protein